MHLVYYNCGFIILSIQQTIHSYNQTNKGSQFINSFKSITQKSYLSLKVEDKGKCPGLNNKYNKIGIFPGQSNRPYKRNFSNSNNTKVYFKGIISSKIITNIGYFPPDVYNPNLLQNLFLNIWCIIFFKNVSLPSFIVVIGLCL